MPCLSIVTAQGGGGVGRRKGKRCQLREEHTFLLLPVCWIHASKPSFCLEAKPLEVTLIHAAKTGGQRRNV